MAFSHDLSRSRAACWAFVTTGRVERVDDEPGADDAREELPVDGAFSPGARARYL
jgi:hypothetical protein